MGKPRSVWFNEKEETILKDKLKKERRSFSNYVKLKCNLLGELNE